MVGNFWTERFSQFNIMHTSLWKLIPLRTSCCMVYIIMLYYSLVIAGPTNNVSIASGSVTIDIDFSECNDISSAFSLLTAETTKLLKKADFFALRRAILQQRKTPRGCTVSWWFVPKDQGCSRPGHITRFTGWL